MGPTNPVVSRLVDVPMYPQVGLKLHYERLQVRCKSRAADIVSACYWQRMFCGRVMSDDNRQPLVWKTQREI